MAVKKLSIGIDLGGTKIATGLVDLSGRLLAEDRRPSKPENHASLKPKAQIQYLVDAMADAVLTLVASRPGRSLAAKCREIRGVGLAAAGPLNVEKGLITHPANFPGWGVVPIVRLLEEALKKKGLRLRVFFQNDAIAAALGEGWIGRTKASQSYAMITLGTGIGTGVILNGVPAQSRGMGSEWGHLVIQTDRIEQGPSALYAGTVEGMSSGTGMLRSAQQHGLKVPSMIELAELGRAGNLEALKIFDEAARGLAILIYNLSIGFHVDKFCVTGGLLPIRNLFLPRAIEMYKKMIRETFPDFMAPIAVSQLGAKAGVIGAARLTYLE